ncbi:MAG: (2Fe-2S)-binding protein [Acidobacteriota bacterium]
MDSSARASAKKSGVESIAQVEMTLTINESRYSVAVRPYDVLLDILRERLHLTGTRRGCDMGTCGCCTVLLDGRPVLACLTLALRADGCAVRTIEGVAGGGGLHPVQRSFVRCGATQCGFCTPGFIMSAVSLLERTRDPSDDEIREAIAGNMCRCTGYVTIIEAIREAARTMREQGDSGKRDLPAGGAVGP